MKNSILAILLGLFIVSCGNSEYDKKKARIKAAKDSLAIVDYQNKMKEYERIDSLRKEEELKVVGDIKFGMNRKEFEKYSNEFKDKCITSTNVYIQGYSYSIGDYYFESIMGHYYDKKLYSVSIIGYKIDYDSYDRKMKEQTIALNGVLKNKYGPLYNYYGLPRNFSIDKGKEECVAFWTIGNKQIAMNIARGSSYYKTEYKYTLQISFLQLSVINQINKEREEEEAEAIKKGSDIL